MFQSIKSSHKICYHESFIESKFDAKFVNTVKSATYQVCVFKSNQMFGTKRLETNWLQKTIEYQTNELNTKYSNWNVEI